MLEFEHQAWACGCRRVAGVDEAGRGPLAGPVVAAAVFLARDFLVSEERGLLDGLTDSKQLSASRRESFFALLMGRPEVALAVGCADPWEIDRLNILHATHLAMKRAVIGLEEPVDHLLVDGLPVPGLPCAATSIVDGDALSLSVAAASVVAKVFRDALMGDLDRRFPAYGFVRHKGYGTRFHTQALLEYGPSPSHRRSFRPVQDVMRIRDWMRRHAPPEEGER